jgi:hypothetical protein
MENASTLYLFVKLGDGGNEMTELIPLNIWVKSMNIYTSQQLAMVHGNHALLLNHTLLPKTKGCGVPIPSDIFSRGYGRAFV